MDGFQKIRVYVRVDVGFDEDGVMTPRVLTWENGKKYRIDRVTDILPASALQKEEYKGDRYTIWIRGRARFLYFERYATMSGPCLGRWYVERKGA